MGSPHRAKPTHHAMMVVGFAGHIGSGKSTLAKATADALGVESISFGAAVRVEASRRGMSLDRRSLQDLGNEMIAEGWESFIDQVLAQVEGVPRAYVVVDGIRHTAAINGLAAATGLEPFIFFVEAPLEDRVARLRDNGIKDQLIAEADGHSNEAEVALVKERATAIVANSGSVEESIAEVLAELTRAGIIPGTN